MISVQNHLQPLSGNSLKRIYRNSTTAICLGAILAVSSCSPKSSGVLRNPNVIGGNVGKPNDGKPDTEEKVEDKKGERANKMTNIALLLPFQLDKIANSNVVEQDIKRSAMALDFYQGFQLGVQEVSNKDGKYKIQVLDTEDNELKNVKLAATEQVENASIIIGPIYPKEIRAFAKGNINKKILQVNPLAATMPTEFNISNLVSLTPPIRMHMRAIVDALVTKYRQGDVVIVYDSSDNDHKQFISGFDGEIREKIQGVSLIHVFSSDQLNRSIPETGTAFVVSGTTNVTQLRSLVTTLNNQIDQGAIIKLFGHPFWERFDFKPYDNFYRMDPTITTESHLKVWNAEVQNFQRAYKMQFQVDPSDYSYKGYDAGRYFTTLLNKYGEDYAEKVAEEVYKGIYSDYQFVYNSQWGFMNQAVILKTYRNGSFQ